MTGNWFPMSVSEYFRSNLRSPLELFEQQYQRAKRDSAPPPVDILQIARKLRDEADAVVWMHERTNDTPAGLARYNDALWRRTVAGCDVFGVDNLIDELKACNYG